MKTRTETRTRLVPHTIDGRERLVPETYTVQVPIPPRDWDQIVLTGVTAAAVVLLVASVAWTTASVGDLLARAVHPAVAYLAATAFDLVWIIAMAVEWMCRTDRQRARLPRNAGYIALAVSMAAVGTHGWLTGPPAVGLVGAAVSALAKGTWTLVLGMHARPLDERTRQWVAAEEAEVGAELSLIPVRRRLARARGQVEAERAALGAPLPLVDAPVTALAAAPVTAPVPAVPAPAAAAQPAPAAPSSRPRYADPAVDAIRALYDTGYRPGTRMMQDAVHAATGTRPSDSACRAKLRPQIEAPTAEPHLAELPPAPITLPPRTA